VPRYAVILILSSFDLEDRLPMKTVQQRDSQRRFINKLVTFVLVSISVDANARDIGGNCITVDYENSPAVTLSGRVTKHHRVLPKNSELRAAEGFYIKLDTPLRADAGGGSGDWDEIGVMESPTIQLMAWNNRWVTLTGKLGRFGSALVSPPIFVEVSTIKGR